MQTLLKDNPQFVYPASRRNEVLGWVQGGVRDFSISRAATQWGIKFPQDPKQTVYVWFDALNGYLSGTIRPKADAGVLAAVLGVHHAILTYLVDALDGYLCLKQMLAS